MDSWDHYRSLLAVLDEGSLSGAARRLGLSQPTVGRHIETLEAELGAPLFTRSAGGLAPTETALALRPHAEAMAAAAEAIVRTASGEADAVRGVIRITASDIVGVEVLPPILTGFHEAHPDVAIELALTNRQEDLIRRESDIAVRMARPTQGALLARRVGAVKLGLFAHRRYLEAHGTPDGLHDPGQSSVGFDRDVTMLRSLHDAQLPVTREFFQFRSDNDLAQLAAIRAGFGIGGVQVQIARRDPNLVQVLENVFRYELEVWVCMHEDLRTSRRMRLMFDWLVERLSEYVRS
ncbi:MAG TPA: LysR family transcriptional regulator [Caulobacteraceae bacterium]|nr:LysR family transcriptional regulator [Caulobacteraceae bacterium]